MGDIDSGSQLKKGVILNYINLALSSLIPLLYTPVMLSNVNFIRLVGTAITRYALSYESGKNSIKN